MESSSLEDEVLKITLAPRGEKRSRNTATQLSPKTFLQAYSSIVSLIKCGLYDCRLRLKVIVLEYCSSANDTGHLNGILLNVPHVMLEMRSN